MKTIKTTGMCLGSIRLAGIDMGFDGRLHGAINISDADDELMATEGESSKTGVGYDSPDGRRIMWGTRDEVCRELARCGYMIIAARTPNGREVRCEPKDPKHFICQPPNDNYWKKFDTIEAALAQWE